ncbi:MAG TPA: 3-hydroxyacyl-CoA dehydrogenase NAD-binding domain-containing protein [Xanthomonadales bacterium]|nr:3-hydroxyacyl-CoA dehydrogenase NAD-binding domain-containing protein [Xanthomonadales bacterium]
MTNTIKYAVDSDGIALLTIDLPGKPMNVLTPELMQDLETLVRRVAADTAVKGAVITSAKQAFIAGADIKEMVTAYDRGLSQQEASVFSYELNRRLRALETCGKPFAAAMNGLALGGGLEVCLACHYRVLVDDPRAVVGFPEVNIGLLPGAGGTQRTPRLVGIEPALNMILQCQNLEPQKALQLGLVHELAPANEVVARARRWVLESGDPVQPWDRKDFKVPGGAGAMTPKNAQTFMVGTSLLAGKTQHNYPAPIAAMSAIYEGCITPIDTGLDIESQYFGQLLAGPVARNMMRTLFLSKGAADKLSRRPAGIEKSQVKKLGILGAGMMGAGIAYVSARAGMQVVLLDSDLEKAQHGKAYSTELLDKAIARKTSTPEKKQALLNLITPTADYADFKGCDLVIEAVFENVDIKADVTRKTEAVIPASAIFASNTSTLPITGLAKASRQPKQFIGIHFFSPVDKMPLVEVIVGKKTSDEAIARSLDYIQQIRKTPIVVNDSRGFFTSRVFGTFTSEGIRMLAEGINPALIENAAKMAGMPVGPLAVTDEVTLELAWKVGKATAEALGREYPSDPAQEVIAAMVERLNRKGKRYGAGFYDYPADAKKHLWAGLAEHFPLSEKQPGIEAVKERLLHIQALESARCFEEQVLTHPADADVGSIFGIGFPAWTGGTLSYIDTIGMDKFVADCKRLAKAHGERFKASHWLRKRARHKQSFYS